MVKTIQVKVKRTGCRKTEITSEDENYFEINAKGKPENNEANLEITKFFSKKFKKQAKIVKGLKSKTKILALS